MPACLSPYCVKASTCLARPVQGGSLFQHPESQDLISVPFESTISSEEAPLSVHTQLVSFITFFKQRIDREYFLKICRKTMFYTFCVYTFCGGSGFALQIQHYVRKCRHLAKILKVYRIRLL